MKILLSIFFSVLMADVRAQNIASFNQQLQHSNQVVFVKASGYNSIDANMFLYERKNENHAWKLIDSFNVVVGKNGLGKDQNTNLNFTASAPVKHEGDGKSPAGIFPLGSVFSYHKIEHLKMPFVQVDTNFYCVDDMNSNYYNTLIKQDTAQHNFNSFECMKRSDSLYEYGVWVLYNSNPVKAGNGSCIFLHVWHNNHSGTAGCTAMQRENIIKLIHWLDKKKNPVLLQIVSN